MKGTALVYTILTVGIFLSIVFFLTSVFSSKLRIDQNYPNSITAFYAAESGIEWQLYNQFKDPDAAGPILTNGATLTITTPLGTFPLKVIGKFGGVSRSEEVSF
ncbi:MAG: hypothetical protein G01um10142_182 [Parcubacteria group bacterium Gr01-1014_2]|nr:MAG: hypothetical protein G01um10142_182 [Parcubacteria group bacterium Gr01-1014_2]